MAFIVTAVTAVEAAIAVTTVASVATAVGAVGAAMTVVGTITKAKELTSIGSKLALAGGVTSLVNGAVTGLTGAAAAEGAAGAADALGSDSLVTGASDALGGTAASTGSSGIINAAQNVSGIGPNASGFYDVNASLMPGVSESLPTTGATDLSGAAKAATAANGLGATAGQSIDDYVANLGPQGIATPAGAVGAGDNSFLGDLKTKLGNQWDSLSPTTKAELLKAGMSIPGAIQTQKNNQALIDLQKQRVNQTSHGSEVPSFGIIQKAQKGGA
jgi:hypothetical protein